MLIKLQRDKGCPKAPGCVLITNVTKATSFISISAALHHSTPRGYIQAATYCVRSKVKHSGSGGDLPYLGHQKSYHLLHHLLDEIVDLGMVLPLRGKKAQQHKVQHITLHKHCSWVKTATVPKFRTQVTLRQHSRKKGNEGRGTGDKQVWKRTMTKDELQSNWQPPNHCCWCCCQKPRRFVKAPTVPFHRI